MSVFRKRIILVSCISFHAGKDYAGQLAIRN